MVSITGNIREFFQSLDFLENIMTRKVYKYLFNNKAIKQFHSTGLFLNPPKKNLQKPEIFWCFQGE